ncbi:exo-alpha-sialidase [Polaromonas sp. UBA4122]|uniref:exo-alpha-sialidase n=1 Tax=Polaromonas sp. UBA4122 TaxID=1947074 RepID=UPI0026ABFB3C
MVRISSRRHLLQPTLLMVSESHWLALMRDQRPAGKVAVAQTLDNGQNWVDFPDLALDNPDASVAGLALAPKRINGVRHSWHYLNAPTGRNSVMQAKSGIQNWPID